MSAASRLVKPGGGARRWAVSDILDNGCNCVVTDDHDTFIVVGTHAELTREEARLIAAAPELLQAARDARGLLAHAGCPVDWIDATIAKATQPPMTPEELHAMHMALRASIAKATGGAS